MESSAINESHPDDTGEEEDFFGAEDEAATEPAAAEPEAAAEDEPTKEDPTPPAPASGDAGSSATGGKSDPTPPAESDGPTKVTDEPAPAAEPPPPADAKKGTQEREYIVFQKIALSERVLKVLLAQIESGDAPEPRVAYFELARPVARNDKQAVGTAYKANKEALGERADMAAVSSRSFQERTVKPRERVAESDVTIA